MNRFDYYEAMKTLAREVRLKHDLAGPRVSRSDLRRVYKAYGITLDLRLGFKNLRGAYFNDECGPTVVIHKGLPEDPRVFTMGHELKHHLADRDRPDFRCNMANIGTDPIEIGAEVFAAELLFPEADFKALLAEMGVTTGSCMPDHLVRLKHESRTTLSYQGLAKRAEFMKLANPGTFDRIQFKMLEEQMFGKPFRRARKPTNRG